MSVSLGPVALPLNAMLLMLCALIFAEAAKMIARRSNPTDATLPVRAGKGIVIAIVAALLIARVVFVIKFYPQYSAAPLQILNIRDGGFAHKTGWFALVVLLLFYCHRHKALLRVYALSAAITATVLVPANIAMTLYKQGQGIPDIPVVSLSGDPVSLRDFSGKPLVLNYWASWCPPCRREMPVLDAAQQANTDVHFIFVNQGERAATVERYLRHNGLRIDNVMLDRTSSLSQASGAAGLPTTLFFNRQGQLTDMHMGEISAAGLRFYMEQAEAPQ